jgi:hypothetical protein
LTLSYQNLTPSHQNSTLSHQKLTLSHQKPHFSYQKTHFSYEKPLFSYENRSVRSIVETTRPDARNGAFVALFFACFFMFLMEKHPKNAYFCLISADFCLILAEFCLTLHILNKFVLFFRPFSVLFHFSIIFSIFFQSFFFQTFF